jgi:hypothetical protein
VPERIMMISVPIAGSSAVAVVKMIVVVMIPIIAPTPVIPILRLQQGGGNGTTDS